MKRSLAEQVQAFMDAQTPKLNSREMAEHVQRFNTDPDKKKVNRQDIENILNRGMTKIRYKSVLARAMGTTVEVLEDGKFVPQVIQTSDTSYKNPRIDDNVIIPSASDGDNAEPGRQGSQQQAPEIPIDMPFSNRNLSATFQLLGRIVESLSPPKREALGHHLAAVLEHPEAAGFIAKMAVKELAIPDQVTSNAQLNRFLNGDPNFAVETRPGDLLDLPATTKR